MSKYTRCALLPIVAALTLAMAPAQAVTVTSGNVVSSPSSTTAQTQPQTQQQAKAAQKAAKKAAKAAKRLAKKCAKLKAKAAKAKKAAKRARFEQQYASMCVAAVAATPDPAPAADGGGPLFAPSTPESPLFAETNPNVPEPLGPEPTLTAVPEPGSLALLGLGLLGLGWSRRRRAG